MAKNKKPVPKLRAKKDPGDILRIAEYLKAHGWTVAVIGASRIQQPFGSNKYNYELVVKFTGKKKEA